MNPASPGATSGGGTGALSGSAPGTADEATVISDVAAVDASLPGRAIGIPTAGGTTPIRQVGRYQIVEKLGEGAMATVYRAHDPGIDRPLVIKFLHAELCRDAEYRMRFLREGWAAGILTHPNIVTVFDVG